MKLKNNIIILLMSLAMFTFGMACEPLDFNVIIGELLSLFSIFLVNYAFLPKKYKV
jgi:hypothetical protein